MNQQSLYEQSLKYFLSPVAALLDDPEVSEVLVNGWQEVYFEKRGRLELAEGVRFPDAMWLNSLAQNLAEYMGRRLDGANHSMSGRLPDGSRVHVMGPAVARNGLCLSIRRFNNRRYSLDELVTLDALSDQAANLLRLGVRLKANIVVSGGTGTGKTTLLNALSAAIPADERILIIEDTSELELQQPHALYLEAQPGDAQGRGKMTIRSLFVDSLRMRPDRIIIGEVRRGEALDMVQSMLSGHAGAMTTVHANTPLDALTRLETLCLMSEEHLPHYAARLQVAAAIHLVVQIERLGGQRRVASIYECCGVGRGDRYRLRPLFRTKFGPPSAGSPRPSLEWTGKRPRFADDAPGRVTREELDAVAWLLATDADSNSTASWHHA